MATRDTYTTQTWENLPSEETPLSAERLSYIEQGIKDAADKRALREIYGDSGINTGMQNAISSVNRYIVNGNGNTVQNGSNISINGYDNNANGSENSINGSGNTVTNGSANSVSGMNNTVSGSGNCVNGMDNTLTQSGGINISGSQNEVANASYSHISGANNKLKEGSGSRYAVFMHGAMNECRGSSVGAVFGGGNILHGDAQFVAGQYNAEDTSKAFILGGGTSDTDRKNIHMVDWAGNAYYAGDITNGAGVSLNSLKSAVDNLSDIAAGGTIAKVFDTKADLDAWLAVEGNPETLVVGQNIYIKATNTPDYWWDGTGLQVLETDKVEIESMTYDETMAVLNATAEGVE